VSRRFAREQPLEHSGSESLPNGGILNVLVLNAGSSSLKFSLFSATEERDDPVLLLNGELSGIGSPDGTFATGHRERVRNVELAQWAETPVAAVGLVLDEIRRADAGHVNAVGYRVVHPGAEIRYHVRITEEILRKLEDGAGFAPLHDPDALAMIRETIKRIPDVPHVACFDTVFHQTMPEEASIYAIPEPYRQRGVKRYGFHGLSCESVVRQMRHVGPLPSRMVVAHLGSGCSVTALRDGESVDTTMGLTPTGGVVMGTRPGDLDPGLVLYLVRQANGQDGSDAAEKMLNHCAGMIALTGLPNDMKRIRSAAAAGNEAAILALKIFIRSVQKAIGGFAWLMGGLDAIVFTGGIGEHDATTRAEVLAGTEVLLDPARNESKGAGIRPIAASNAKMAVFVVPAQEDLVIALHVKHAVQANT
jgi:acetate kinase